MFVGSRAAGEKAGAKPIARVIASAAMGVHAAHHGHRAGRRCRRKRSPGPGSASRTWTSSRSTKPSRRRCSACLKGLEVAFDDSRVNPNGGAIAVGHPLGASGARLALTAARQLQRSGGRYALVSLCIGGGQGMAAILEKV